MVLFYSISESQSPPEGDTTLFLSQLSTIWKGFINMQSVAKFVTKAFPVSGYFDYLSEVRTRRERSVCVCVHVRARARFPKALWSRAGVRRVTTFLLSVWTHKHLWRQNRGCRAESAGYAVWTVAKIQMRNQTLPLFWKSWSLSSFSLCSARACAKAGCACAHCRCGQARVTCPGVEGRTWQVFYFSKLTKQH